MTGLFSHDGLTFPATELIQNGGPTTPVGGSPGMCEQFCDLLPAPLRRGPLQVEGLSDRLARDGELESQAPGVSWRLEPRRSLLRWTGL